MKSHPDSAVPDHWPPEFVARMTQWLGNEADAFFTALARRDYGLRLNSRRGTPARLKAQLPWPAEPIPWCPEGVWLRAADEIGADVYHTAGLFYSQDPSAMAAAVLLDPQPGEWVLDIAAAPGGKTTHIAARMQGSGVLVANEVVRRRAAVLAMNVERMGATNALIVNEPPERLAARWSGLFDAVLVDAPCSGEGMFSRDSQAIQDWSLATVQGNAQRQQAIMAQAALLVRRGGRLLYGTCTFAPEENEGVIAAFLAQHSDFELADLPPTPGLSPGRPEWINAPADLRRAGRLWPHTGPGHGHFYALLRRTGEPPDDLPERWEGQRLPGRVLRLYQKSLGEILQDAPPEAGLILTSDDALYITPLAPPLWEGLHVLRPGWWVGALRHNQVNPDHAMAMALRPEEVRTCVTLTREDSRVTPYLRGEFWADDSQAGFLLVTVDGFPLGWAKSDGDRVRSRYPVHLRR